MSLKTLLQLVVVLLFVTAALAQTTKPTADPVSGIWGDPKGPGFDLKYNGKSTVSGTIRIVDGTNFSTAPIKKGTFHSQTRALKLEGDARKPDGTISHFVIEGTVDKTEVAGTFKFDNNQGNFTFRRTK
jgi:hypothetical protein